MHYILRGESPCVNLIEVKTSEAQGHHRKMLSEGSVEQTCELTNRNLIIRRHGWTSLREEAKSISIKNRKRKSGSCARKGIMLTPGDLRRCFRFGTGVTVKLHISAQKSAEGIVGGFSLKARTIKSGD